MAHEDLQANIDVIVNAPKVNIPTPAYPAAFKSLDIKLNVMLEKARTYLAPAVGQKLADVNKRSQQAAIQSLNAVCTRTLFNSITIKGGRGKSTVHYKVGTNIRRDYPHYVVYGRPNAVAHKKAMKFKPKCQGDYIYRRWVRSSKAKPYPVVSDALFEPSISSIVQSEVQRVLGS